MSAAHAGQLKCLEFLLGCSPAVEAFKTTPKAIPDLHLACQSGSSSAINLLLNRGLDPNTPSDDGSAALHFVASLPNINNLFKIIGMLLEAHADSVSTAIRRKFTNPARFLRATDFERQSASFPQSQSHQKGQQFN
jgi:ankyrin repeat protein